MRKLNGNLGSGTLRKQKSKEKRSSNRSFHSSFMDQISENKFKTEMVMNPKMLLKRVKEPSANLEIQK